MRSGFSRKSAGWIGTAVAAVAAVAIVAWRHQEHPEGTPATAIGAHGATAPVAGSPERLSFNLHVQPVLSEYCYHCHGPDAGSRKADLRLDREEDAFAPRKDGPVIVRGDPDRSPLIRRIESSHPEQIMPPPEAHKDLGAAAIALLRRWVQEGAEYEEHWAFTTPQKPAVPAVTRPDWARTPIDHFVLAKLEEEGLAPSPEADRYALIRRVTYDLTGLPPTPEEIDAFVADERPDAYERLVDRLLASPRYGEHRARYWLDLVRYGDTHGLDYDSYRQSWPYRDYVIRAFNENKPFDQFTREQIAGDLLPAETFDQWVATGFNRGNITTNEDGAIPEELQYNYVTDRVQAVGTAFLGLTVSCAACHDHKFDPLTQRDFFRLSAFFNNTLEQPFDGNLAAPFPSLMLPPAERQAEAEALLRQRAEAERRVYARQQQSEALLTSWLADRGWAVRAVSPEKLQLRFRFDEGSGKVIRNTAPGADPVEYATEGPAIAWGEQVHFWPSGRFGGSTRLLAERLGDFDTHDAFTAGGWFKLREAAVAYNGPLLSRRAAEPGAPGWELYWEDSRTQKLMHLHEGRLRVNLVHAGEENALSVRAKQVIGRTQWKYLAFSYDGSGRAAGIRIYIDGEPQEVEILQDALQGSIRTSAPLALARPGASVVAHQMSNSMAETAFQDVRLYGRELTEPEMRRLGWEDVVFEILQRPREAWNEDERQVVVDYYFATADREMIALRAEKARLEQALSEVSRGGVETLVSVEREGRPSAHVLFRGLYSERRERVSPGVPEFLPPLPPGARQDRLGLAEWLVSVEHPLTARVTVNRMWQELFGMGLVETAGDFGTVGARPSHPHLLDWLAVEFRESGWNVKRFYRQVVMSATYRQSARVSPELLERDPDNRLLARGPRFRLDGEMIRDGALAVSGLLVEKVGGPSVKPYQPPGIWEPVSRPDSNTYTYQQDQGEGLYRRSLYTFWKRTAPPPILATFDAPARDACVAQRERTNTPLQALVTLNAPTFVEASRQLAARLLRLPDASGEQRLELLSKLLVNRPPNARSREVLEEALAAFRTEMSEAEAAQRFLAVGDSPVESTVPPSELAAWTLTANLLLNSDEALNK